MAKIAKVYKTIWKDSEVLFASDTRRAFSDAVNLINGNLDSANFIRNISLNQDSITFSTSNWSSTSLLGVIGELKNQNYHNIHFMGTNRSTFKVFKGRGFVNDVLNRVQNDTTITASNHNYTGGNITSGNWCILMGPALNGIVTASDISLTPLSNISQSLAWDNDKQGYYPSIASGNRRAFFVFKNFSNGATRLADEMYLDPPWENQIYKLTNDEASAIGFTGISVTQTNGFSLQTVHRIFDSRDRRYGYWVRGFGQTTGTSAEFLINDTDTNEGLKPLDGWRIDSYNVITSFGTSENLGGLEFVYQNSSTVLSEVSMTFNNEIKLRLNVVNTEWQMRLQRVYSIVDHRVRGDRG